MQSFMLEEFLKQSMNESSPKSAPQPTFPAEFSGWKMKSARAMIKDLKDNDLQTSFHAKRNN
jgi:hypothetical protein